MSARTVILDMSEDLPRAFAVIKELRGGLDLAEFTRVARLAASADGYRLIAREVQELSGNSRKWRVAAVMGCRILHDMVHGSHLYVDDLVTTKDDRGQGHGSELLRWAESEARRLGLTGLRLSVGLENEGARRFYEREGWTVRSFVFKKKVETH